MFILTQFRRHFSGTTFRDLQLLFVATRDVRGGAFSSGAGRGGKFAGQGGVGRGVDENPRGCPGRGGAKKRLNQLIRNFDKSA